MSNYYGTLRIATLLCFVILLQIVMPEHSSPIQATVINPDDPLQSGGGIEVAIINGQLVITSRGELNDQLILYSDVAHQQYVIANSVGSVHSALPGALPVDNQTLQIPFDSVTGDQIIINAQGGDDVLTLDFSLGSFAKPIIYNGGTPNDGLGDGLALQGSGLFETVTHQFINASDGQIFVTENAPITYIGLEPIFDNLDAANRVFQFTGGAETITLSDDTTPGNGMTQVDSMLGESVTFVNPSNSLTIQTDTSGGTGADTLNIQGLDSTFTANLVINGDSDDTINFQTNPTNTANGNLSASANQINVNTNIQAGTGNITLQTDNIGINTNLTAAGTLTIEPFIPATTIGLGGGVGTLNLTDAEIANLVDGFSGITIGDTTSGTGQVTIDPVTFNDPLTIIGGAITVNGLDVGSNDSTLTARTGVIREGGAGPDVTAGTLSLNGTLVPGGSPGSFVANSDVILSSTNVFSVELNGTVAGTGYDQLQVTGAGRTVTWGNATLDASLGYNPAVGDELTIIDVPADATISGIFNGLAEGATLSIGGLDFQITYQGGAGNQVILTALQSPTPPHLQATNPISNSHTAPLNTTVSATYNQPMAPSSVSTQTFAVHARETGQLTQTFSVIGNQIIVTPPSAFKPGELVQVSATTGTTNITGTNPVSPTVWQFRAKAGVGPADFDYVSNTFGGGQSEAVALGDVDGDGDLDAVVANGGASDVHLNDGTGAFGAATTVGGGFSSDVALGDVDGDGDLDLAVGNNNQQNVIYLNDGDGTFDTTSHTVGPINDATRSVALGDVDGDGDLDLAVGNIGGQNIVVLNEKLTHDLAISKTGLRDDTNSLITYTLTISNAGPHTAPGVVIADALPANVSNFVWDCVASNGATCPNAGGSGAINETSGAFPANGQVWLTHTTVTSNTGQGLNNSGRAFIVRNTIVANSITSNDCAGAITSNSYNTSSDLSCASFVQPGDQQNQTLHLAPLAANGGPMVGVNGEQPMLTHALRNGSPAIDAGFCDVSEDQRGQARPNPISPFCDVGAYESNLLGQPDLAISKSVFPTTAIAGETITYTIVFTNLGSSGVINTIITDIIPVTITNPSYTSSGVVVTPTGSLNYAWQVADMLNGDKGIITITGQVSSSLTSDGVVVNLVEISTTEADTDTGNNSDSASLSVFRKHVCFATHNDGTTVFSSGDAQALRDAVAAASGGGTVKVAGICPGVAGDPHFGHQQVVDLNQNITVRGGYTTSNWAISYPITQPTVLDADLSGRVVYIDSNVNVKLENLHLVRGVVTGGNHGGGIHVRDTGTTLVVRNTAIYSNTVDDRGGGLYSENSQVSIVNSHLSNNKAGNGGAGHVIGANGLIEITNSFIQNNQSNSGGGLFAFNFGAIVLDNSVVMSNQAVSGDGGGLYSDQGVLTVTHSTVSGNTASHWGGGIYGSGFNSWVRVVNSTISHNQAAEGGGVLGRANGQVWLTHTTVISNTGQGITRLGGTFNVRNTIVANSIGSNDCAGAITSNNYNISSDLSCTSFAQSGDQQNQTLHLAPLAANGGPTVGVNGEQPMLTHALLNGSPAIDAGFCDVSQDQRGQVRPNPMSSFCDVGAYESSLPDHTDLAISKSVFPTMAIAGETITYTIVFTNLGSARATSTVITDVIPVILTNPSYINSGVGLTPIGSLNYAWQVADMLIGATGIITITGQLSNSAPVGTLVNTVSISNSNVADSNIANNSASASLTIGAVPITHLYLPILFKEFALGPDLVVDLLNVTSNGITVTIQNAGTTTVSDAFWVDLYINPSEVPSLNKTWQEISSHGAAWGVTKTLSPGESLTLTLNDIYFDASQSNILPIPGGNPMIYVLVDAVNRSTTFGAVDELDETNNLASTIGPTSAGLSAAKAAANGSQVLDLVVLPGR